MASPTKDDSSAPAIPPNLVLTSDLPRSVFQCDSCGSDISRTPRLRCAVCDDFDLCMECGATAAARHGHKYRVCDSTRYPVFPRGITTAGSDGVAMASDDPKSVWTAEEDLRLLRGIQTHGLGNWPDIAAEVVNGPGSSGKTAKRCMERYLDDFLGRYGYILPPLTLDGEATVAAAAPPPAEAAAATAAGTDEQQQTPSGDDTESPYVDEATRSSTRRSTILRNSPIHHSVLPNTTLSTLKKYNAISTPVSHNWTVTAPSKQRGQEVGRDLSVRAEQTFVRALASTSDARQVAQMRQDWERTRLNQPGGPTALPMKPADVDVLPGSDIAGYMPRRGDFDIEWENDAEDAIADMEFTPGEPAADRELKLKVLKIYNARLDEREQRKQFVISRKLFDLKQRQADFEKLPRDERDLVHRMRLFERFHTPEEHKAFIDKLLKAKRLRKEIAKLQMYRRMGIRTLEEAERYELDKARRQFHTQQKASGAAAALVEDATNGGPYWKQYKTSDRKIRKSVNRTQSTSNVMEDVKKAADADASTAETAPTVPAYQDVAATPSATAMDVDEPTTAAAGENTTDKPSDLTPQKGAEESNKSSSAATDEPNNEKAEGTSDTAILLSDREMDLCKSVDLQPHQYLDIKRALISEALAAGLVDDKKTPGRTPKKLGAGVQRSLVHIDVERRGSIIDFVVRAGWIPPVVGAAAAAIQPEPPTTTEQAETPVTQ